MATYTSNHSTDSRRIYHIAVAALCCASIAAGAYITIPAGAVPFTLQTMFVLLTGLILTPGWAAAAVAAYLLMGSIGLPVFSAGSGGFGHLLGPTGGYLWGFLPAAVAVAAVRRIFRSEQWQSARWKKAGTDLLAAVAGTIIIYAAGVTQLSLVTGMGPVEAISAGMLPFLIGDAVKLAVAITCAGLMRPLLLQRGIRFT
ncbi:MAG: biotin transporter BioY [Spirochaeta sp.]